MRKFHLKRREPNPSSKSVQPSSPSLAVHGTTLFNEDTVTTMTKSARDWSESLQSLIMAQEIVEESSMVAPEMLPDLVQSYSQSTDGGATTQSRAVPTEVTAIVDEDRSVPCTTQPPAPRNIDFPELETDGMKIEKYTQDLEAALQLIQRLSLDLQKSRLHENQLLKHNQRLLVDLKGSIAKEDISDEYRMLKQELMIIKTALFCGVVYIFWGGRTDILGILALVWLLVDFTS